MDRRWKDQDAGPLIEWVCRAMGADIVRGRLALDPDQLQDLRDGTAVPDDDVLHRLAQLLDIAKDAGLGEPPPRAKPETAIAAPTIQNVVENPPPPSAPPPIIESPPRVAPSAQTHSERVRIIRDAAKPVLEERNLLITLLGHLREAEEQRPHNHRMNKWIRLAQNKVRHCLVAEYYVQCRGARGHPLPRKEVLALYSRLIKRSEKEMADWPRRSPLLRIIFGKGYLAPEEVIKDVARYNNLKLSDELMQAILRQGRD